MSPLWSETTPDDRESTAEAPESGGEGAQEPAEDAAQHPGRPLRACRVCGAELPASRRKVHVGRCLTTWKSRMRKVQRNRKR